MNRRLYIALFVVVALFSPSLLFVTSVSAQTSPSGSGSNGSTPSTNSDSQTSPTTPSKSTAPKGPANNITGKNVADELNQDCKAGAGKDYDTTKQVKPGQQFAKDGKAVTNLQGIKCTFTQNGKKITGTCNSKNGGDCKADSSGKPNPSKTGSTGSATSSGATPSGGSGSNQGDGNSIPGSTGESNQQQNPSGSNSLPWQNLDLPAEDNSAFHNLPHTSPDSNTPTGGNPSTESSSASAGIGPSSRESGFDPGGISGGSTDLRVPSYGTGDAFPNDSGQSGAQFASQASFKDSMAGTVGNGGALSENQTSWSQSARDVVASVSDSLKYAASNAGAYISNFTSSTGDPLSSFTNPSSISNDLNPQSESVAPPVRPFAYFDRSGAPAVGDITGVGDVAGIPTPYGGVELLSGSKASFLITSSFNINELVSGDTGPMPASSASGIIDWHAVRF